MSPSWQPGDCALLRGLGRDRIWWVLPVRVVQDTPDLTALYWCAGSRGKAPQNRPVVEDVVAGGDLPLVDWVWKDTNVLSLAIPGEAVSVYAMWVAKTNELCCWYINLQHPLIRSVSGFDTCDYLLDMVVSPDRSEWHWKDEDEMQRAVMLGVFSKEKAQAIRTEGERALEMVLSNAAPFEPDWADWRPPTDWTIPELTVDWDKKIPKITW